MIDTKIYSFTIHSFKLSNYIYNEILTVIVLQPLLDFISRAFVVNSFNLFRVGYLVGLNNTCPKSLRLLPKKSPNPSKCHFYYHVTVSDMGFNKNLTLQRQSPN